jgi:hypothetical protein
MGSHTDYRCEEKELLDHIQVHKCQNLENLDCAENHPPDQRRQSHRPPIKLGEENWDESGEIVDL